MMNQMQITYAQYIVDVPSGINSAIKATIDGVEMSVPLDHANRHFIAIQKAVADGQLTIQEASE